MSFETWLSSDNELHIPGYQLLRLDRDSHGGVYLCDCLWRTI